MAGPLFESTRSNHWINHVRSVSCDHVNKFMVIETIRIQTVNRIGQSKFWKCKMIIIQDDRTPRYHSEENQLIKKDNTWRRDDHRRILDASNLNIL